MNRLKALFPKLRPGSALYALQKCTCSPDGCPRSACDAGPGVHPLRPGQAKSLTLRKSLPQQRRGMNTPGAKIHSSSTTHCKRSAERNRSHRWDSLRQNEMPQGSTDRQTDSWFPPEPTWEEEFSSETGQQKKNFVTHHGKLIGVEDSSDHEGRRITK